LELFLFSNLRKSSHFYLISICWELPQHKSSAASKPFLYFGRVIRLYSPCRAVFRIWWSSIRYALIRRSSFLHDHSAAIHITSPPSSKNTIFLVTFSNLFSYYK